MSAPIGDGNGTRAGCRLGFLIAVLSVLLIGVLAAVCALGYAAVAALTPQPASSTSTRSTP